ncbi:MAG: hypothetical protein HZB53_08960 [Chloroflexi bacterium]|nr:hypothetical protein [Chloroflexota bacterium]
MNSGTPEPKPEQSKPARPSVAPDVAPAQPGTTPTIGAPGDGGAPIGPPDHSSAFEHADPATRANSLLHMQETRGNQVVSRVMIARAVQRWGFGIGNQPPRTPPQATDPKPIVDKYSRPEYAELQLKATYINRGEPGMDNLIDQIGQEIDQVQPTSKEAVLRVWRDKKQQIVKDVGAFVTKFETDAKATVKAMLLVSKTKIEEEKKRYGLTEKTAGSGDYKADANDDTKKMAAAVQKLMKVGEEMVNLEISIKNQYAKQHPSGPMEEPQQRENAAKALMGDEKYVAKAQEYEKLFTATAGEFPVVAAFKDNPAQMGALAAMGRSGPAATVVGKTLQDKLDNIEKTGQNVDGGKLNIWSLPNVITGTKAKLGVKAGSVEAYAVDDKVRTLQKETEEKKQALMAISLAVGVIAAVATAGGSLVVAGAAAGLGLGIDAAELVNNVQQYQVQSAASDTSLDRAKSISQNAPDLFWLCVEVAMVIVDVVQAGQIIKQAAGPVRGFVGARKAMEAAHPGQPLTAAEAEQLSKKLKDEVEPALAGLPQETKTKVTGQLDPSHELPSVVRVGEAGTWTEKELRAALSRSGAGMDAMTIEKKFGVNVITAPTVSDKFIPPNKVFINSARTPEQAADSFIHEMTHAKYHHEKLTVNVAGFEKMPKTDYISKMCREEAEAEANVVRHKFDAQWKQNKPYNATSPVERAYSDAATAEMQRLMALNPNMDRQIALMRADLVARDAVYRDVMSGGIKNGITGEVYPIYYGNAWEKAQPPLPRFPLPGE